MSYPQNLITTFPLYARDEDCTHNRHWCRQKNYFVQPAPLTRLPTWIFKSTDAGAVEVWCLNRSTDEWIDLTSLLTLYTDNLSGTYYVAYSWASFSATTAVNYADSRDGTPKGTITWENFTADCAELQLSPSKGSDIFYSELFYVKDGLPEDNGGVDPTDPTGCILLDCSAAAGEGAVGDIPYPDLTGFAQRVFLPCDIGRPEYEIFSSGSEDGNRLQNATFQRMIKRWTAVVRIPEYMTDALALFAIHGNKIIYDQYNTGGQIYDVAIETDWSENDCLSRTAITFRRDFFRKQNC